MPDRFRARKVKCDEQKPSCHRCTSTGRTCEGYGIWGGGSQSQLTNSTSQERILLPSLGLQEITPRSNSTAGASRALVPIPRAPSAESNSICEGFLTRWYSERTVKKLPGLFPSRFWDFLLLQAGRSEAAVKYATLALTSAHKSRGAISRACNVEDLPPRERFAMKAYSKAVQSLNAAHQGGMSEANRVSLTVTLMTCILFVCLEVVQRRYGTARRHLMNGLRLIESDSKARGYNAGCVLDDTDDLIAQMFLRLWLQVAMLGQELPTPAAIVPRSQYKRVDTCWAQFRTTGEARRHLDILVTRAELLHRPNIWLRSGFDMCVEQVTVQCGLDLWLQTFNASFGNPIADPTSLYRRSASLILRMYHSMATIQVNTALPLTSPIDTNEMLYDGYLSVFQSIITYATEAQQSLHITIPDMYPDPECQECVIDAGWLPPLYYTALKCRHYETRQQALALIVSTTHREGFWDPRIAEVVAKEVIRIEGGSDGSEVAAHQRLHNLRVALPEEGGEEKLGFYGRQLQQDGGWEDISEQYDAGRGKWHVVTERVQQAPPTL